MEPVSTAILAALAKLAEPAIKDSYDALKDLIQKKFGAQSKVATAVRDLEERPESDARKGMLQERIEESGAEKDEELVRAARELIERIEAQPDGQAAVRKVVNQTVHGSGNIFSGTGQVNVDRRPQEFRGRAE
jgi:nucleotide-binding universal stress UspA family protein